MAGSIKEREIEWGFVYIVVLNGMERRKDGVLIEEDEEKYRVLWERGIYRYYEGFICRIFVVVVVDKILK